MMKKSVFLGLSFLLLAACEKDAVIGEAAEGTKSEIVSGFDFSENDVLKGRMRVKLKKEPDAEVAVRSSGSVVTTGIKALDRSASAIRIERMERTFPFAGKFEERTRREGLHLWYDVWYSEEVTATRAVAQVAILDDIEVAVPIRKVMSTAAPAEPPFTKYTAAQSTRTAEYPFDDPFLSKQWSYHNPGTEVWQQAGADIRLFDVWRQYNGNPGIIIAVVDGGIALDNPDLQANLWVNRGETDGNGSDDDLNGYADDVHGYNFVSMTSAITPHRHGTHVAGTIGAVNNNGMGVCGIAGGDGTPGSGVKLMSCQIFEHPNGNYNYDVISQNIPAAIKYGADNGAVISQNSWGYAADSGTSAYIDPADKAAIDYFVKYAGCDNDGNQLPDSPMKGGIVLFASGNANTSDPVIAAPADYEKVLGVAAIGPDYTKPVYSNYGDYMDISAPGGLSNTETGIYSTTISQLGFYEYRYGTSMACPHVAGVAALVIEKNGVGKSGFTAAQLEEILLDTAYDIDEYNPRYAGKLGYGGVDAVAALQSVPSQTTSFALESNPVTDGILSFRVDARLAGNALITIYNSTGNKVYRKNMNVKRYIVTSIDVGGLAAGYYTLEYVCNKIQVKEKFIKY